MSTPKLDEQARKVLASLVGRPALLHEVLHQFADGYDLAGPWLRLESKKGSDFHERRDALTREPAAQAAPLPDDSGRWQWQVRGGNSGNADSAEEARDQADEELRSLGYLLA